MPKHAEDGPIDEAVAKVKAASLLADPKHRDHPKPDQVERTRNGRLNEHQGNPQLDSAWKQVGDDWIHSSEG